MQIYSSPGNPQDGNYTHRRDILLQIRISFIVILAALLICPGVSGNQAEFPPAQGPYTGDYIYITEPGRYTLEHPVSHQYPIGIIIAAPSVILDGQGYSIRPAASGSSPTVGIWVCLTDRSGRPVTGVTIKNVTIGGEGHGIYAEGTDSSLMPWGQDRSGDPVATTAAASPRSLTFSEMTFSDCQEGITLNGQTGVRVSDMSISGCSGSGITLNDGQAQVIRCLITKNGKNGINLSGGSGTEISSSTISENKEAGIRLKNVSGVKIVDNILDNSKNLVAGPDSSRIVLSLPRETGNNIVGGRIIGGNYWADGGVLQPAITKAGDKDSDGIADSPYEPVTGISDLLPLLKPGEGASPGILTLNPESTPAPLPEPTVAPVATPVSIISGTHAVIVSDTIPAEMTAGTSYPVVITLLNDGSENWLEQYQIGIMALDDTAKYGPEWMAVPVSAPVESGGTRDIQCTIRAPTQPGSYTFKYQAGREGSGVEVLYGRAYSKTVTVR